MSLRCVSASFFACALSWVTRIVIIMWNTTLASKYFDSCKCVILFTRMFWYRSPDYCRCDTAEMDRQVLAGLQRRFFISSADNSKLLFQCVACAPDILLLTYCIFCARIPVARLQNTCPHCAWQGWRTRRASLTIQPSNPVSIVSGLAGYVPWHCPATGYSNS